MYDARCERIRGNATVLWEAEEEEEEEEFVDEVVVVCEEVEVDLLSSLS